MAAHSSPRGGLRFTYQQQRQVERLPALAASQPAPPQTGSGAIGEEDDHIVGTGLSRRHPDIYKARLELPRQRHSADLTFFHMKTRSLLLLLVGLFSVAGAAEVEVRERAAEQRKSYVAARLEMPDAIRTAIVNGHLAVGMSWADVEAIVGGGRLTVISSAAGVGPDVQAAEFYFQGTNTLLYFIEHRLARWVVTRGSYSSLWDDRESVTRPTPEKFKDESRPIAARAENVALADADARWADHGEYLQRLIGTVQVQLDRLLSDRRIHPRRGSVVAVKFVLNAEGRIARVLEVDSRAPDAVAQACVSSLTDRAPYGPWTEGMTASLGEEQQLAFTFQFR